MSNSLWPHGLKHARPPCSSPTPRACWDSCPSSQWCHPTISSSVIPFSSCLQSFPASGPFPTSQFFSSGGQSVGVSASVLPMNTQDWSPLGWTGWISLQSKGLSKVFSNTTVQKHQFCTQLSLWSSSHIHTWLLEKPWLWLESDDLREEEPLVSVIGHSHQFSPVWFKIIITLYVCHDVKHVVKEWPLAYESHLGEREKVRDRKRHTHTEKERERIMMQEQRKSPKR